MEISHEMEKLIKQEYQSNGAIFNLPTYLNADGVESIYGKDGKFYSYDGKETHGFTTQLVKMKFLEEKPKSKSGCTSPEWAFQNGCWPYKKTGHCKHMEVKVNA